MRVTRVVFSVSPYQFKFSNIGLLYETIFLIFCDNLSNAKNVSELMKSSIERKYGSNGSSFGNGKNGSNGKTDIDKAVEY